MINGNPIRWKTIETKAGLLCMGVKPSEAAERFYLKQNPEKDRKTGNVGLHMIINKQTYAIVTLSHRFNEASPYSIGESNGFHLLKNGKQVAKIEFISMPDWYSKKTTTGKPTSRIFLHEGTHYMHMEYRGCDFFQTGKPCKFCGTGGKWSVGTPKEIAETVAMAFKEDPSYHVCLGGGTRMPLSRNTEYFLNCARDIRKNNPDVPIFVEMAPPETNNEIKELVNAGVSCFGFNLEIWDDEIRKEICTGKHVIPKQRYIESWEYATGLLGKNKVGSCQIIGLEPLSSSIEGIEAATSRGVQVSIMPFKPWHGSMFEKRPSCSPEDVLKASKVGAKSMLKHGIDPQENYGCFNCAGCTVAEDILKFLKQGDSI